MAPVEGAGLAVSGRRPSAPSPSPPRPARAEREIRATPFKRSRSRVYYASQTSDNWQPNDGGAAKDKSVRRNISLSPTRGSSSSAGSAVVTPIAKTTPAAKSVSASRSSARSAPASRSGSARKASAGYKEPAILEVSSSGEEVGEGEGEGEASSPLGSFRGSLRGSPSHRSQDSGYSDSGESNAHNDSDGSPATPPNVKHITRVYFGDSHDPARLYNDKIVCSPELKAGKVSSPSGSPASIASEASSGSSGSSPGERRAAPLEELAEELEHKSLLEASAAAAARRTGAVRKRSTNAGSSSASDAAANKRHSRRSSSSTVLSEPRPDAARRPAPLRARRRWSAADLQQQQPHQLQEDQRPRRQQPSPAAPPTHASRSTSTNDLPSSARAGVTCSLDALDDPVPASRVAGDCDTHPEALPRLYDALPRPRDTHATAPRPHHARRLKIHPAAIAKEMRNGSVSQWLSELRTLYEAECMNTLQSKSVPGESGRRGHSFPSTRDAVRAIQRRAHAVSTEFARLCQRLEWLELDQVPVLAKSLVCHINTFLKDYTTQWTSAEPDFQPQSSLGRQSKVIEQICQRLTDVCSDDHTREADEQETTRQVVQVVTALGHAFTKLVDLMLSREIKVVVAALEEPRGEKEVSSAVSHLTALGVDGGHICRLIARLGGVRALLSLCLEPRLRQVRVASLRALATVCCVVEGIVELEKAGGVEVVAEVLCDEECPEEERSEAAGVLAQVTSPWVEDNHRLAGLHDNMDAIVAALTGLAERTRSAEIFLLASAALANLTFLDGGCVGAMRRAGTARVLLRAARGNPSISIFTKDQIATVLANLAGSRGAAEEVVAAGGVSVLLALLNTRPAPSHRLPEVATAERVQQKSAIALSRLCGDADVARKVAQQGGAERLVQLCKDEGERNQSDAVLVACLAALRKMASSLGSDELRDMDAAELVEPRLLDSFLTYSSRQESYV